MSARPGPKIIFGFERGLFLSSLLLLFLPLTHTPNLAAQEMGLLTGRVVNADGEGATDAQVRIMSLARRVQVDEDGGFTLEDLPPGSYLVEASSPRWGQAVERFEVRAGRRMVVLLYLDPLYQLDELVVSAGALPARRSETYQPTSALTGWDLARDGEASLGETLAEAPGVTASYNGPGSSRPIIRGLGGDRVRVLEGGVGSGDVSNQGPDHAVAVEPMSAERIEVVRGPATLLYGSGAVGGVVNVIDARIPREVPDHSLTGSIMGLGGTVADEVTGGAQFNGSLGSWAWHLSGLKRTTGDFGIPGFAEHQHEGEGEGESHEEEEPYGVLPNSAVETARGAMGLSWIGDAGFLGLALSGLNNDYGVPGHGHGHEEEPLPGGEEEGEEEEEGVTIGMEQRRLDLEGAWRFGASSLRALSGRFGMSDYRHTEFEGEEIGTRFSNDQWEGRLAAEHALFEPINGSVEVQMSGRTFRADGDEAYVPPSDNLLFALFAFQELEGESVRYQLGGRVEGQRSRATTLGLDRSHLGVSFSGGLNWTIRDGLTLAFTGSRSEKIPSLEELFTDGPHAATFAYEVGDPQLQKETAWGLDATLHRTEGALRAEASGFLTRFHQFIYQEFTGESVEGLPFLQTVQGDALFMGGEGSLEVDLVHKGEHHLLVEGWGDYVRAQLANDSEPLPRIPPHRLGSRLRYDRGTLRGDLGLTRVGTQDRVAPMEEETSGYTLVDMSLGIRLLGDRFTHDLVIRGSNLTNQEARSHTSFLKELAPLPGRDIRFLYRVYF